MQLVNGARISEVVEATDYFVKNGERGVKIQAKKGSDERLIVLPKPIEKKDLNRVAWIFNQPKDVLVKRIKSWIRKAYGFNTHSLRYACIGYFARKGVAPQLIAKMTGHKKLDHIVKYTQKIQAENILWEHAGYKTPQV